ncbi:B12-binding domain-containing radical SAM protein [Petrachloros mirabilis]
MKVLLLNPPPIEGVKYTREGRCQERESVLGTVKPPLTLAIMAALLRNNDHQICLIDATILDLGVEAIIKTTEESLKRPDIIVVATSTPTIISDMQVVRALKQYFHSMAVAFGPHASGVPSETLDEFPWLDVAIVGEPEPAVLQICSTEDLERWREIDGVCFRKDGEIFINTHPSRVSQLESLPEPAWDLLPLDAYRLPLLNEPYVLIETSRGCPPACDFCVVTLVHGKAFRQKSTAKIITEIENIYRRYKIRYFYLWGDTVTLGRSFLDEFGTLLTEKALPVRWMGNTRVDTLPSFEFVQSLKNSGCWMLSVGVESGDDNVRSTMSKRFQQERIRQVFGWLRKAGIASFAFFILGYLGENRNTMEKTINLAIDIDPDYAAFYPAVPYPGTEFYRECKERDWLGTKDWSKYDYSHYIIENHILRPEIVLPLRAQAYRRFYLRPRVIFRNIKMLRSLDAMRQITRWGYDFFKSRGDSGTP